MWEKVKETPNEVNGIMIYNKYKNGYPKFYVFFII